MFEWLEEQWHEIRFAEKSMRVKIVLLMLLSAWLSWELAGHEYADDIGERDYTIAKLKAENANLKAAMPKKDDKGKTGQLNNPDDNTLSDDIADKIYELKNELNNARSNADIHYRIYKQRVGNAVR